MLLFAQETVNSTSGFSLRPLFQDSGIPLAIMGITVVFAALVLVSLFISWLPRLMRRLDGMYAEEEVKRATAAPQPDADAIPEETLVVIAAAVAAVVTSPHRVVRIRGLTPEDLGWSLEGRIQHHTSHKIQHHDRR